MAQLDEHEYAALFVENHARFWTLATAVLGDRTSAEDVVQEASITGLRRLKDFEPGTNFAAWMSQIVRFTALNHLKSKKNRKPVTLEPHMEEEAGSSHAEARPAVTSKGELAADQNAFDDRMTTAISGLDPDRRACLLLRVVQGLSYDEIAEIVGVLPSTAMSHVHRAKAALRADLGNVACDT